MFCIWAPKEDVIKDTLRAIKTASPGGGHIISSSNTIHSDVPYDNYMQMLETVRKYRELSNTNRLVKN